MKLLSLCGIVKAKWTYFISKQQDMDMAQTVEVDMSD